MLREDNQTGSIKINKADRAPKSANSRKQKTSQSRKQEFLGLLLIILGILALLSLLSYQPGDVPNNSDSLQVENWLGLAGAWLSSYLYNFTIGYPILVLPFLIMYWGWFFIRKGSLQRVLRRTGYFLFFALCFSVAFALPRTINQESVTFNHEFNGLIGLFFAQILHRYLGAIGSVLVLFTIMLIVFLSLTEVTVAGILIRFVDRFKQTLNLLLSHWEEYRRQRKLERTLKAKQRAMHTLQRGVDLPTSESWQVNKDQPLIVEPESDSDEILPPLQEKLPNTGELLREPVNEMNDLPFTLIEQDEEQPSRVAEKLTKASGNGAAERIITSAIPPDYKSPGMDLLDPVIPFDRERMKSQLLQEARILEEKLAIYDIEAKVVQIHPGPLITQFEVEPAEGVKISKFFSIADDLAMVMRAPQIRILAPIPGKAVVGIEIPNRQPEVISFRQVIDTSDFRATQFRLPLMLGVDTTGKAYLTDLVRMPHLLVAGSTGSGKSVCLNTIIASLLYKLTPQSLRFILIDPKKLELSNYADLRNHHLITLPDLNEEVVTTPENAITILGRVWQEMEIRFNILARANVRTLEDYNDKIASGELPEQYPERQFDKLPYIVVIIDELADLLMVSGQDVEEPIGRLAHKARAVGIHLIVATQRPSTDVITGAIKANFPCRIAFKVFSKTDSRVVLDVNGAEALLGRGDMLFQPSSQPQPVRLHSPLISNDEINRIIQYITMQPPFPAYPLPEDRSEAVVETPDGRKMIQQRDPLFYEALKLVVRHQQGSISLLQRRLRIGYARAARLIDELEQAGFVGVFDGSKAREVLVSQDELDDMGIL